MDSIDEEYLKMAAAEIGEFDDEDDEFDDDDVDETFGVDEEYDDLAAALAEEEESALAYAAQEGREWRREFAENLCRLKAERHFYSDVDEYVEEKDSVSGATVRLVPGMHLCDEEEDV